MTNGRSIIPVLLGCGRDAYSAALLFRDFFGVTSHVFANRRSKTCEKTKFIKMHIHGGIDDVSVAIPLLLKFAAENNGAELFLIPCGNFYADEAMRMRSCLGGIYRIFIPNINSCSVISDEKSLCEQIKKSAKEF